MEYFSKLSEARKQMLARRGLTEEMLEQERQRRGMMTQRAISEKTVHRAPRSAHEHKLHNFNDNDRMDHMNNTMAYH
jgi:hypothetical protein